MLSVGLTGGIASGKTTVSDLLAEHGAAVIDTDVVAREVVEPGTLGLDEVRAAFGDSVIGPDGRLDRAALRRIVFDDDDARRKLESILHPRIQAETQRQAQAADGEYLVIVVPLLLGSPIRDAVDRILVVDCSEETQIARLMARDTESEAQARRMLAAQSSRDDRLAAADDIVRNDDDVEFTRDQVAAVHTMYRQLARLRRAPADR